MKKRLFGYLTACMLICAVVLIIPSTASSFTEAPWMRMFYKDGSLDYYTYTAQTVRNEVVRGDYVDGHYTINGRNATAEESSLRYFLHIPENYDPNKSYPLVVFLHGQGGCWSYYKEGDNVFSSAYADMIFPINWYSLQQSNPEMYDCFFVYPRFENYKPWSGNILSISNSPNFGFGERYDFKTSTGASAAYRCTYTAKEIDTPREFQLLMDVLDGLIADYNIDVGRQYITGFSLGAVYTMDIINHYPDRFSFAAPVCTAIADITYDNAKNLLDMDIWAFGGLTDTNVAYQLGEIYVEAINNAREDFPDSTGSARFTAYNGGHTTTYPYTSLKNEFFSAMFTSRRDDVSRADYITNIAQGENSEVTAITSATLNDNSTYDICFACGAQAGDFTERGMVITATDGTSSVLKEYKVETPIALSSNTVLGGENVTITASGQGESLIYTLTLTDVPSSINAFSVQPYVTSKIGEYLGRETTFSITISGNKVSVKKNQILPFSKGSLDLFFGAERWADGDTVTLTGNLTTNKCAVIKTPSTKMFDFNSYNVTCQDIAAIGSVYITPAAAGSNVTFGETGNTGGIISSSESAITSYGNVTINSGNYSGKSVLRNMHGGTMTINGGRFRVTKDVALLNYGTATINSGSFMKYNAKSTAYAMLDNRGVMNINTNLAITGLYFCDYSDDRTPITGDCRLEIADGKTLTVSEELAIERIDQKSSSFELIGYLVFVDGAYEYEIEITDWTSLEYCYMYTGVTADSGYDTEDFTVGSVDSTTYPGVKITRIK